jgi:hypothetical protein
MSVQSVRSVKFSYLSGWPVPVGVVGEVGDLLLSFWGGLSRWMCRYGDKRKSLTSLTRLTTRGLGEVPCGPYPFLHG